MFEIKPEELEQLVQSSKVDKEKFTELYRLFFPKIFSYVAWRVGKKSEAEDVTSEVFVKVVRYLSSYKQKQGATFQSWLYAIAKTTIADHYRKRKSLVSLEEISEVVIIETLEGDLDTKLLFKELFEVIQDLPEREAEVLRLRFSMGLTNQEIARTMNLREKSVSSSIAKGIKKLKDKLIVQS